MKCTLLRDNYSPAADTNETLDALVQKAAEALVQGVVGERCHDDGPDVLRIVQNDTDDLLPDVRLACPWWPCIPDRQTNRRCSSMVGRLRHVRSVYTRYFYEGRWPGLLATHG